MPTQSACELAQVYNCLARFERLHVEVGLTDCQQELKVWYRPHRLHIKQQCLWVQIG